MNTDGVAVVITIYSLIMYVHGPTVHMYRGTGIVRQEVIHGREGTGVNRLPPVQTYLSISLLVAFSGSSILSMPKNQKAVAGAFHMDLV